MGGARVTFGLVVGLMLQPVSQPWLSAQAARPVPPATAPAAPQTLSRGGAPSEVTLGVAVFPSATFLGSFDAGQGQRYYLYGATASFAELVTYYRGILKQRGELVFEEPAVHMFDTGRFREETMAFPPSVTIKDYLWGGRGGYLNPVAGAKPARFPTIIQIVPSPAGVQ
jgi:hypothetical protein